MKFKNILAVLSLVSLAACGGSGGGGGSDTGFSEQNVAHEMNEATPGTYYSVLRPVNFYANGFIPYGAATFTLKGDQLQVNVVMDDDQSVPHRQSLHLGTRCPRLSDDTNGDGFIDYEEAMAVVGPVVVPLDNDLNSQEAGAGSYPRGPSMTYNKIALLSKINADLWLPDPDPADNLIKLTPGRGIGFEGRVVLVHGTTPQNHFPSSLATNANEPVHLALPVVCGVLEKIE